MLGAVMLGVAGLAWGDQPTTRPNDMVRGKELYDRHCVQCHGAANDGKGPASASLVAPVPDLQGQIKSDDFDALVPVILDGRGTMPSFVNSFDKYDARRALRHMAGLTVETATEAATEETPEAAPEAPNDDVPPEGAP